MADGIPILTDKGREAVKNPQASMTARCRSILVQIDGKRSLTNIRTSLRGLEGLEESISKLLTDGYMTVSLECRDLVKDVVTRLLGAKAPTLLRKIDDLHAKFGDNCWDHLDEIEKAARLFYGEVIANQLKAEISNVIQGSRGK